MKICIKCNIEKDLSDFPRRSKYQLRSDCFVCHKESMRKSYIKNKSKRQRYYKDNKNKILSKQKKDSRKEYNKKYYELNKEKKKYRGLYNGYFNYGWDIDHIIPISSAKTEDDIIKLNHYTNLQPLCSKLNRHIKRANI